MFDMKMLGENIRHIRKIKGITQEELAQKAGMSTMSIRRYENGERIITEETLDAIANALGTQTYIFFPEFEPDNEMFNWRWPFPPTDVILPFAKRAEKIDPFEVLATAKENKYTFSIEEREIVKSLAALNSDGQQEAAKRVAELTEIPRYRRQDAPQPSLAPSEGADTTLPPDTPEKPPEGE